MVHALNALLLKVTRCHKYDICRGGKSTLNMGILIVLFMAIAISSYKEQLSSGESEEKNIYQSAVVSDIRGINLILMSKYGDEIKNILFNAGKFIVFSEEKSSDDILKLAREIFGTEKEIKPLGLGGGNCEPWNASSRKTYIEQQYQSPFGLKSYDVYGIRASEIDDPFITVIEKNGGTIYDVQHYPFITVIKENRGKIYDVHVQQKSEECSTENIPSIPVYSRETAPLTVKRF